MSLTSLYCSTPLSVLGNFCTLRRECSRRSHCDKMLLSISSLPFLLPRLLLFCPAAEVLSVPQGATDIHTDTNDNHRIPDSSLSTLSSLAISASHFLILALFFFFFSLPGQLDAGRRPRWLVLVIKHLFLVHLTPGLISYKVN